MNIRKWAAVFAAALALLLTGCQSAYDQVENSTTEQTATMSTESWEDVVELKNTAGDTTTVYLFSDGRYLDRQGRFFTYDGANTWTCDDGTIWSRKDDTSLASATVHAEFALKRYLAQRSDYLYYSDAEGETANKVAIFFDADVTDFAFLQLEGEFDANGNFSCTQIRELYTADALTQDDIVVVQTELEGLIPTRGISFTNEVGEKQYYYLTLSGEDNLPLLVQFDG